MIYSSTDRYKSIQFGDLIKGKPRHGLYKPPEYVGRGTKIIKMGALMDNDFISDDQIEDLIEADSDEINKHSVIEKDLLFLRTSLVMEGTGKCSLMVKASNPVLFVSNLIAVTLKNDVADSLFYYYFFSSQYGHGAILSMCEQTAAATLRGSDLQKVLVPVPPLSIQKQISIMLSALDDKIELNRKMNKTLEEIGKALFKRWFVDFEFPSNDGKPYKSSGGEMVDSELGEIPEGWEVGKLSDFGKIVCGKTPPKSNSDYFGGITPFIKIPDMHGSTFIVKTEDKLSEKGRDYQKNKILPKYSLCVSCIATVGLVSITSQESQTNQQINSIVPSELKFLPYLYFQLKRMEQKLIDYASGGSATPNLNTGDFANLSIIFPKNEILNSFFANVWSLPEQILNNDLENSKLEKMRDSLLPRLMSGKLRVLN